MQPVSRNGVFFMRILSPDGINAQLVCYFYGPTLSLYEIGAASKPRAWSVYNRNVITTELANIHIIRGTAVCQVWICYFATVRFYRATQSARYLL